MLRCVMFIIYGIHLVMTETCSHSSYHFVKMTWYCTYKKRKI